MLFFFNQVGLKEGIDSDLNSFVDPSLFLSHDPPHRVIASLLCAHHSQSPLTHGEWRKIGDEEGVFGSTKG